jgi:hypothetical protein
MVLQLLIHGALAAPPSVILERPSSDDRALTALARLKSGDDEALMTLIASRIDGISDPQLAQHVGAVLRGRFASQPGGVDAELTRYDDSLIGSVFPVQQWRGPSGYALLSEHVGPTVIHLWDAGCSACLDDVPRIDATADGYSGVHVVSLSVDRSLRRAQSVADDTTWRHDWGWGGPRLWRAVEQRALPAYYVLDDDLVVRHAWTAKGGGDLRLEAALDAITIPRPPRTAFC